MIKGETKKIATASASGSAAKPRKKVILAITTMSPRKMWKPSRFVRNTRQPPAKGKMTSEAIMSPITERISTTSCSAYSPLKNLMVASLTANVMVASVAHIAPNHDGLL